jgi:hypothetical protein
MPAGEAEIGRGGGVFNAIGKSVEFSGWRRNYPTMLRPVEQSIVVRQIDSPKLGGILLHKPLSYRQTLMEVDGRS